MNTQNYRRRRAIAAAIGAALVITGTTADSANAAPVIWTGASDLEWSNTGNWNTAASPGTNVGDSAVFTAVATGSPAITVTGAPVNPIRGIAIGDASLLTNPFSLSGSPLTFIGGGLNLGNGGTGANRVVFDIRAGGGAVNYDINNDIVLNTTVANSPQFVVNGSSKSATFNGVISNGAAAVTGNNKGLAKDGPGTLRLNNTGNSYTGITDVQQGTLLLGGDAGATGVLGAATSAVNVGVGLTGTQSASLLTAGGFTVSRNIVVPTNAVSGTTVTIGGGSTSNAFFTGDVALNRPVVQFQSAETAVTEFSGVVSGVGGITKTDTGTIRLTNTANSFAGPITINNGTIQAANLSALGTGTSLVLGGNQTINPNFTTLAVESSGETLSRTIDVRSGGGAIAAPVAGSTLTVSGTINNAGNTNNDALAFGGDGNVVVSSVVNHGNGTLLKSGAGTVTLTSDANTHAGGATVTGGVLEIAGDGSLGAAYDGTLAGLRATAAGGSTTPFVSLPDVVITGGGGSGALGTAVFSPNANRVSRVTLDNAGSGYTSAPVVELAGGGGATPTATAAAVVKGLLTLDGGTLRTLAGISSNRAVVLGDAGGTFDSNGFDSTLAGVITNGTGTLGGLMKTGTGTLTLTGANSYAGQTLVSAGTLLVNGASVGSAYTIAAGATLGGTGSITGDVAVTGTIAPGASIESLDVIGNVLIPGTLAVEIDPAGSGSSDLFAQSGGVLDLNGGTVSFTPAGTLDDPAYVFATYGNLTGVFASTAGVPTGYAIDYSYQGNQIALVAIPEPATTSIAMAGAVFLAARRRRGRRVGA